MVPIVTQLATDFEGRALVGTVDVNTQDSLRRAYGINAWPTFVFFKGGREASRFVGTMTYGQLSYQLQGLLATP
jgi:thioredoxin 1